MPALFMENRVDKRTSLKAVFMRKASPLVSGNITHNCKKFKCLDCDVCVSVMFCSKFTIWETSKNWKRNGHLNFNTFWSSFPMKACLCLLVFLPTNRGDRLPVCFVLYLPVSCLFLLLTTNLLARAICNNGNCFTWRGVTLELNNGYSCEIWQQGLTFGSLCLLPRLIYVSTLCPVPHQEEVLQETQNWGRN